MARHTDLGKWGESLAADCLTADGFAIVERNWRMGHLEIDIVAQKDDTVVIAEVKTRSDRDIDPLECINRRKILNIVRAAETFIRAKNLPHKVRFDLFAISGTPDDYTIEHLPDAFHPPVRTYR